MSKVFHRTVIFLSSALLLTACESDEAKLSRLETDKGVACLNAQSLERAMQTANLNRATTPYSDTLGKQWREAETKCTLATRELNKFMHD